MHSHGHILYCSRIRKNVTDRETDRETKRETNKHTEKNSILKATLIPWIAGLSGPIVTY